MPSLFGGVLVGLALWAMPPAIAAQVPVEEPASAEIPVGAEGEIREPDGGDEPVESAADEPAEPERELTEFKLPLSGEQGGGVVSGVAVDLEFERDDYVVISGFVEIEYQDVVLKADRVEVDLSTRLATAEGNVIVDQGPRRVAAEWAEFHLEEKTGTFREATAYVDPDYYFSGAEVSKIAADVYTVTDGVFTSCEDDVPDWSFRLGEARVEVEGYARVKHASMRLKKLPVLYTPYIVWPTKRERTSGLLVPNIGYSDRRGAYLGLAYYQVLGRSYDTTMFLDLYSEGFVGLGNEFRYRPTEGTLGNFRGYVIQDADLNNDWRWKLEFDHEQNDLPGGMRGVATVRRTSDFEFFRDFERDFDRASRSFEESRAFISGNWGSHLLNIEVTDRESFIGGSTTTDRRLPDVEYQLRATQLGKSPFVVSMNTSASYLSVDRSETYVADYGRFDIQPRVSVPFRPASWLSVSIDGGYRFTWYEDSLDETRTGFSGDSLSRAFPVAGASLVGPSFSRIFSPQKGRFGKLRHVIEPRVTYTYVGDFDDQLEVPQFDGVDGFATNNSVRVALVNRLKAKARDEEKGGGARDILSLEIGRSYSFDDDLPGEVGAGETSQAGPLDALLRFNPSERTSLRVQAFYSPLFQQVLGTSVTSRWSGKRAGYLVRWNRAYRAETGDISRDQARIETNFDILPKRLKARISVDYDIERSEFQEKRLFLDYLSQCYSLRLELRDYTVNNVEETDYRFAFTLKNVGTFLDLTGRYE